ncbi:hypothetical protein [Streptomyces canus]|uniref:hypothetical protein n=1 Tax=Streptomyces canus TaxID=58343 RepID=UPI000376DAEB|nr:hypothetical protein [Streptomyces canus]
MPDSAAGLAAAGLELDRAPEEMGGMLKSTGSSGASQPMTVNETVIALIRPKPDLDLVAGEPLETAAAGHRPCTRRDRHPRLLGH